MAFRLDTPYYPIPGAHPEATFGAVVEMLLRTRLKLHLETDGDSYDEDVNTYLAGLLVSYIDPVYLHAVSPVLSQYDIDVFHSVSHSADRYHAYWIYKVNADDLLVSLGLFRPVWQESKVDLERAKRYYSYASEYQRRMYRKATAVGEIQTKLSASAERYLTILSEVRQEYLHFIEREIKTEEMALFTQHLHQMEEELPVKSLLDRFLDAYSGWRKGDRSSESRQRLLQLLEELKQLDPEFPAESFHQEIS